ncbi:hypothetical protein [Brachybacterium tyrofermentans]|uniref:hypothetical protein n=1 Tax=Brachybacterium tyrofermentans TaxID=47848 RepID=UPI003F8EFF4D
MRAKLARTVAITLLSSAALAGCASQEPVKAPTVDAPTEEIQETEEPEETEETVHEVTGHGVYQVETEDGAVITLAVPGEAPEDLESVRESVHAEPVDYLVVDIDNRQGVEELDLHGVTLIDSQGMSYEFHVPYFSLSSWYPESTEDARGYYLADGTEVSWEEGDEIIDAGIKTEKYMEPTMAMARGTNVFIGIDGLPEDIVRVVVDDGYEGLDATYLNE